MTPEKHFRDALDVLGTTFAAANELNHLIAEPITDQKTHDRVHELQTVLSGSLMILPEYDVYTGGIVDAIEDTRDSALGALSTSEAQYKLAA